MGERGQKGVAGAEGPRGRGGAAGVKGPTGSKGVAVINRVCSVVVISVGAKRFPWS